MSEAEEKMLELCGIIAAALDNVARANLETLAILQSALGLREGLRAPDELIGPAHFLDGAPIQKGLGK